MLKSFLENALQYGSRKSGINFGKVDEYIKMYASDRRYKLIVNACTCTWNFNQDGFITYRGTRYYFTQYNDRVVIE